ncbi:MAG: hypothetical protein U9N84_06380 [Actinomycetota bacterium]|nr:hypothetical protein [Actinomycetota bacterium]
MKAKRSLTVLITLGLNLAACGGGGDDAGGLGEQVFGGVDPSSDETGAEDNEGSSSAAQVGPVTQTADASTGWVEVDGQRFDFEAFGSTHYSCELLPDRITINFQQTTTGNDLTLQASILNGEWIGNFTFAPTDPDKQVSYGATLGSDPGTLGIGEQAISYDGTFRRVEDFDIQNAQDVQATIAVNCAAPGGDPTAEVGGQSFNFPLSGAQSITCMVSNEGVEVLISHSSPERIQLQIDVRDNGGELLGGVFVTSGDDNYDSIIPADGTGLSIEGSSLTYEGTFSTPSGEEVEGSASVTCG